MSGRDDIDFGKVKVQRLFTKIFVPTLLGMVSWALLTVVDGIFVGWGIGSNGIAAINISYPVFMLLTGFALMVGMGVSVVASIHLAENNEKAARINVTQAMLFSTVTVALAVAAVELFSVEVSSMLGSSSTLLPMVHDYMVWLIPSGIMQMWAVIGLFIIRLDGAPKYAMWCNVVPAGANMVLDWLFIFPLDMGVKGAAIASSLSVVIGGVMALVYLLFFARKLRLYRLKASATSLRLSLRNIFYQCKIGFSALLGEVTMAVLMITGNKVFMEYLGDPGVGAFGVACYYLPFVFMFGNSIAQSAQPIVSYNYGLGRADRVKETLWLSFRTGVLCSLFSIVAFTLFPQLLVHLFIDANDPAAAIAINGFPLFAAGFLFFVLNIVAVGYLQSIKKVAPSVTFSLLRGMIFLFPTFILLPRLLETAGIWLALPLTEAATFLFIVLYMFINRKGLF